MKMKRLFIFGGIVLVFYMLFLYDLPSFFLKQPEKLTYSTYNETIVEIIRFLLLFILFAAIGVASITTPINTRSDKNAWRCWGWVFLVVMLLLVSLSVYVNPHGLFSWNFYPSSIVVAARTEKINLYRQLDYSPTIVFLGSSRAFTIPANYVEQKLGYKAFNMSVNGGGLVDFIPQARFIFLETRVLPPSVLVVELIYPDLSVNRNFDEVQEPFMLLPYMSTKNQFSLVSANLKDVFGIQSVSDSIFQVAFSRHYAIDPKWSFEPDGTGVEIPSSKLTYTTTLERMTHLIDRRYRCDTLSLDGQTEIETLVKLAAQHQSSVLFYRSPLNADYLDVGGINDPLFKKCETLLLRYMKKLKKGYPNVFYRDLTYYEPIGSLRWDGFDDAYHLKPNAAQMLIDALTPNISRAVEWALQQRAQSVGQ